MSTSLDQTYLGKIVNAHRARAERDARHPDVLREGCGELEPVRDFAAALRDDHTLSVIAEIKRRSPSKGDLNVGLDPEAMARTYARGGAAAMSVLTDEAHFGGSSADLQMARNAVELPVLRKDFTVCVNDVYDARLMGADCVLLIVAALSDGELAAFHSAAADVGLHVLIETHDEIEVKRALDHCEARIIGVNQRDLFTFEVDQQRAVAVAEAIPDHVVKVAESGVRGRGDALALAAAGYDAVLVGEHLVTSGSITEAVAALRVPRTVHRDRPM